jgi:hypothetical protein
MYPVLLSGYSRKYCPNNPEYAFCYAIINNKQNVKNANLIVHKYQDGSTVGKMQIYTLPP